MLCCLGHSRSLDLYFYAVIHLTLLYDTMVGELERALSWLQLLYVLSMTARDSVVACRLQIPHDIMFC